MIFRCFGVLVIFTFLFGHLVFYLFGPLDSIYWTNSSKTCGVLSYMLTCLLDKAGNPSNLYTPNPPCSRSAISQPATQPKPYLHETADPTKPPVPFSDNLHYFTPNPSEHSNQHGNRKDQVFQTKAMSVPRS